MVVEPIPAPRRPVVQALLCFSLLLCLALLLQFVNGSGTSDFGGAADEPAHYVTGLMVKDYLLHGFPGNPVAFAEQFYLHYPQVAIGHWPPLFYAMQALWMIVVGESRPQVLLFTALLTAGLATLVYWQIRQFLGWFPAFTMGCLLLVLPRIQHHLSMTMVDLPVAALSFAAALACIAFLERDTWASAGFFGLLASLAILTKANALCLALVPLVSVLLLRTPIRLLSLRFYVPALVVAALCGPFYWWSWKLLRVGTEKFPMTLDRVVTTSLVQTLYWRDVLGVVCLVLMLLGMWLFVVQPAIHGRLATRWAVMGSLCLATYLFHCLAPTNADPRKLFIGLAPSLVLAAGALGWLAERIPAGSWSPSWRLAPVLGLVLLAFFLIDFRLQPARHSGFNALAEAIYSHPEFRNAALLVASDRNGESVLVAEFAELDTRPALVVVRGNKYLSHGGWHGQNYHLNYQGQEGLIRCLESVPVRLLILHHSPLGSAVKHYQDLVALTKSRPDIVVARPDLAPVPRAADGTRLSVWEMRRVPAGSPVSLQLDLSDRLQRNLTLTPGTSAKAAN